MASPTFSASGSHPDASFTSVNFSRRTYKRASGASERPVTPRTTLHDFHKDQLSPLLYTSPDLDHQHRLRRKPSLANLSTRTTLFGETEFSSPTSPAATPLLPSAAPQTALRTLLPAFSHTPNQHANATSPSLSSTVTTLPSTPGQTPIQPFHFDFQHGREPDWSEWNLPLRTKRKYPTPKQAKRLPLRAEEETWEVFAAVLDTGDRYRTRAGYGSFRVARDGGHGEVHQTAALTESDAQFDAYARRERLVRFVGVGSESDSANDQEDKRLTPGARGRTDAVGISPYARSEFRFPAPPNHSWTGSLGHITELTPPASPATLHYKGASFDLVNPHASLLLGAPDFETPAEIDGLLDDYFDDYDRDSSYMNYDEMTGEMDPPEQPSQVSETDSARRHRTLYNDADSARRNIMHLPGATPPTPSTENVYQMSPLAGAHNIASLNAESQGNGRMEHGDSRAVGPNDSSEDQSLTPRDRSALRPPGFPDRGSSEYPHSTFSDPFDLDRPSDGEEEAQYGNIDHFVANGHQTRDDNESNLTAGEYAMGQDGRSAVHDDENASALQDEFDTTYNNLFEHYDYTRPMNPRSPFDDDVAEPSNLESSTQSPERGRGTTQGTSANRAPTQDYEGSWFHSRIGDHQRSRRQMLSTNAFRAPVFAPPVVTYDNCRLPLSNLYNDSSTDVPPSNQTYGDTGQLLQITPVRRDPDPVYDPLPEPVNAPALQRSNWPLSRSTPEIWDNVDTPQRRNRNRTYHHGLSGDGMARLPTVQSRWDEDDEDAWEDTQASGGRRRLPDDLPRRPSQESYADTSVYSQRLSFPGQVSRTRGVRTREEDITFGDRNVQRMVRTERSDVSPDVARAAQIIGAKTDQIARANLTFGDVARDQVREDNIYWLEQMRRMQPEVIQDAQDLLMNAREPTPSRRPFAASPANSFEEVMLRANQAAGPRPTPENTPEAGPAAGPATQSPFRNPFARRNGQQTPMPARNPSNSQIQADVRSQSRSTDRRRLLRGTPSPGMAYSESAQTFQTVRHPIPGYSIPYRDPNIYVRSPLDPRRITTTPRSFATSQQTQAPEEYELKPMSRMPGSRAAIRSQTSPIPLQLGRPKGPLNDVEMALAEPNWTAQPDFSAAGALSNTDNRLHAGLRSGSTPMLVDAADRDYETTRLQKEISSRWFVICTFSPFSALAYGLGYMDWVMRRQSAGRATQMRDSDKWWMLVCVFPLNLLVIAIFVVMVVMIHLAVVAG